ncbi:MAG: hypothetical protein WAV67_05665 [Dokdonella sp.]
MTILTRWADSADPPRVLVLATPAIATAALANWPEWMGLGDFGDAHAQAKVIDAWQPDLVISLCNDGANDGDVPCRTPSRALRFRFPNVLDRGVCFERIVTPYQPLDIDPKTLAQWLRDTCCAVVAGVFLPGMLCVDFADLVAVLTTPRTTTAMVMSLALSRSLADELLPLRTKLEASRIHANSIYVVAIADRDYTTTASEMAATAIQSVFPAAAIAGPAVPSVSADNRPRSSEMTLIVGCHPT